MCLYPRLIKNRKYTANKKNGGNIPPVKDKRVLMVPVGCGKCMECKKMKSRNWSVRLHEEIKEKPNGHFVTLTFSTESLKKLSEGITLDGYDRENEIARKAVRYFLERWRKKYKKSVRHWLVTELGGNGTEHIHLHGIIWTDKPSMIKEVWKYGKTDIGEYVNEKTINYITKYITKTDFKHKEYQPKIFPSAGIGAGYLKSMNAERNKYKPKETREHYTTRQGFKINLPIYYRNHIYTDEEKENLWLEKLDKQKRYVDGVEIDISKGEDIYYKWLEVARKKNTQLGYGDNKINWERRKYERERRNLIFKERMKKTKKTKKTDNLVEHLKSQNIEF